MNKHTIEPETR